MNAVKLYNTIQYNNTNTFVNTIQYNAFVKYNTMRLTSHVPDSPVWRKFLLSDDTYIHDIGVGVLTFSITEEYVN